MSAVDAGAVHAGGDEIVDELGLRRRLRRQRRHHPDPRRALPPLAEDPLRFGLELGGAGQGERRGGVGDIRLAGQAAQRDDQGVEGLHHAGLAAAERREAARREPELQLGDVAAAQRDVMGQVRGPLAHLFGGGAPFGPEPRASSFDVCPQRLHFGEEGGELFEVFGGFRRHVGLVARPNARKSVFATP